MRRENIKKYAMEKLKKKISGFKQNKQKKSKIKKR
jgi:hypothetical protein